MFLVLLLAREWEGPRVLDRRILDASGLGEHDSISERGNSPRVTDWPATLCRFGMGRGDRRPQTGGRRQSPDGRTCRRTDLCGKGGAESASIRSKGEFANSFSLGERDVPCTTFAFFFSELGLTNFILPKSIARRSGREYNSYFSPQYVPSFSAPMSMKNVASIELSYRNHRRRVVFPLEHLPLPSN